MSTPAEAAKNLTTAMRAHVAYGIAGARRGTLDALALRGIVHESERRPGYLELSPVGLCVKTLVLGYDPTCLTDAERVELREGSGDGGWVGPAEWEECDKHPGHGSVYRWAWRKHEGESHEEAIESSEPVCLQSCSLCYPDDDE